MPSVVPRNKPDSQTAAHLRRMVYEPVLIEVPVPPVYVNEAIGIRN